MSDDHDYDDADDSDNDYDYDSSRGRQNSKEAYDAIAASGALGVMQWGTYATLWHHGPLTRNELDQHAPRSGPNPCYSRRLVELERRKVIVRLGRRPCSVTGFRCDVWDVTSHVPETGVQTDTRPVILRVPLAVARIAVTEVFDLTSHGRVKRGELVRIAIQLDAAVKKRDAKKYGKGKQ